MNDYRVELIGTFVNPNAPARPYKKAMKPGTAGYHRGVIAALTLIYRYDGLLSQHYLEVLHASRLADLLKVARRDGDMKSSGLSEYVRTQRPSENSVLEKP